MSRRQRTRPDAPESGTIPCCRARKQISEDEGKGKPIGWLCTVLRSLPEGDESERDPALMAAVGGRTVLIPDAVEGSSKIEKGEYFQVEFKSTEEGLRATKFSKVNAPVVVPRAPRPEGEAGEKPARRRRQRTRPDAPESGTIPCCRARKQITEGEGNDGREVGWLCTVLRSLPEGDESERDSALMAAVGGRTVLIPTTVAGSDKVEKGEYFQVEFKSTEEGLRATKFSKVNAPAPRPPREPKEKKEGEEGGEQPRRRTRRRRNGRKPKGDDEAVDKALSRPGDKEGEGEAPKPRSRRRRRGGPKKEGEGEAKEGGAERKPRRRGGRKPAEKKEAAN